MDFTFELNRAEQIFKVILTKVWIAAIFWLLGCSECAWSGRKIAKDHDWEVLIGAGDKCVNKWKYTIIFNFMCKFDIIVDGVHNL